MRNGDEQVVILADGLQRMVWGFVGILALAYLLGTLGCGAQFDNENDVAMPAALRARVEAECGDDALILKADEANVNAVCCITYLGLIPRVHCLTAAGQAVVNPTASKLRAVAEEG